MIRLCLVRIAYCSKRVERNHRTVERVEKKKKKDSNAMKAPTVSMWSCWKKI